jgi:hypothetical protein
MVFPFYDFCKITRLQNPFKVSSKGSPVIAVHFAGQKLGFIDVTKEVIEPVKDSTGSGRLLFAKL